MNVKSKGEPCACTAYLRSSLNSRKDKKGHLIQITCKVCGKRLLSNTDKEFCYDCARNKE